MASWQLLLTEALQSFLKREGTFRGRGAQGVAAGWGWVGPPEGAGPAVRPHYC